MNLCRLIILFAVTLGGCAKVDWRQFAFEPDKSDGALAINQSQEGFFILRYTAYRGRHRLGGTLNEVSIRNLTGTPLKVESLALVQIFRGTDVTLKEAPIAYAGMNGSISSASTPTRLREILPGEWMSFDFPTVDIPAFKEGEKLFLTLRVSLASGAQRFERKFEFTKTIKKSQLPSF